MIQELDTRYGKMFVPDTDSGQYWWLKNIRASPEDEFIEMICGLLKERPRGVALDIGANFGCWTLPLSKVCDSVEAFEPQKCVFDLLRKSVLANNLTNVILFNSAVGAERKEILVPELDINKSSNFGGVSLGEAHSEQPDSNLYPILQVNLDSVLPRMLHYSFLKADVEGGEYNVLLGAKETILRCKPILFVEALHKKTDADKLAELIQSYGYTIETHLDNFLGMPI